MKCILAVPVLIAAAVVARFPVAADAPESKPAVNFTLRDSTGKPWTLHDQKAGAVVVAFLSPDCPMSNGYLPALAELHGRYAGKGVAVVGVYPDPDVTAEQATAHAKEYKIPFPVLRDPTHAAVKSLGAAVTPQVVVLDARLAIRYRGRIDDGYSARMKAKLVTRHDLAAALDGVLAGKPGGVIETKAFGCAIAPLAKPKVAGGQVTFHKDVAPLLQAHCQSCHRPGQVGPFALGSYKQAVRWAGPCLEEVQAKRMPPWKPAANPLLAGERSLPPGAARVLERWVELGMPEGDPKDAPPPATYADTWTLGTPDLILEAPDDVVVGADGRDLFRVLVFPTNLPEDKYVVAMEVKPGNPRVVHHTIQVFDTAGRGRKLQASYQARQKPEHKDRGPGYSVGMGVGFFPNPAHFLGGWAPGLLPKRLPAGVGQRLPKGADVCMQIHYHRTGKEERDRTRVGLYFAREPVTEHYQSIAPAGIFRHIPAGDKSYVVENRWRLIRDATVYRLVPHMHLLGKDIELTATLPDGKELLLIRIPAWDYAWQEQYQLKQPLDLPRGTVLRVRATYDNSADNPLNPNHPPRPVGLGEQTTNEMCFVFLGVSFKGEPPLLPLVPVGRLFPSE